MLTRCYYQSVQGFGTPEIESITSYTSRLAREHHMSAHSFLNELVDMVPHSSIGLANFCALDGQSSNGYLGFSRSLSDLLAQVTGNRDVPSMTLLKVGPALSGAGTGAIKRRRHWCKSCYVDDRRSEVIYDRLIWQIADVTICSVHKLVLISACPVCNRPQPAIPLNGRLDLCASCGADLAEAADVVADAVGDGRQHEGYQRWLHDTFSEIFRGDDLSALTLNGDEMRRFLIALRRHHWMTVEELAKRSGLGQATLRGWVERTQKPELRSLLRFSANMFVSPWKLLSDPEGSAAQSVLPIRPEKIYNLSPTRNKKRYSHPTIRSAVQAYCDSSECPPSIRTITRTLSVTCSSLYSIAGDLLPELVARRSAFLAHERECRRQRLVASGTALLEQSGGSILRNRRTFCGEFSKCESISVAEAKKIYPALLGDDSLP